MRANLQALSRLWASLVLALKHLFAERWLSLAALLGITAAVVLAACVPIYADSIYYRVLSQELANLPADQEALRAPIKLQARRVPSVSSGMDLETVSRLNTYMLEDAPDYLDLPLLEVTRHAQTRPFLIFASEETDYIDNNKSIARMSAAFLSDIETHIKVTEGAWPDTWQGGGETLGVLVNAYTANRQGLQKGDTFTVVMKDGRDVVSEIPVRVAGIWEHINESESYWRYAPEMIETMLLVSEQTFEEGLAPRIGDGIYLALWNLTLDGGDVHTYDVEPLQEKMETVQRRVDKLGGALSQGPIEELESYRTSVQGLTIQLYTYLLPILAMDVLLLLQVANLTADRRANEFSVLRGRGATQRQLVMAAGLEGSILGVISLILGVVAARYLASILVHTTSFLRFDGIIHARIAMNRSAIGLGIAVAICALLLWLFQMSRATRHTHIEYRASRFRGLRIPWVRRLGVTFLLLIPAVYGLWQLRNQPEGQAFNPFENPLLFLIPTLVTLAAAVITTFTLPVLATLFAKLLSVTRSTGALMALRQIARQPRVFTMPLVLLIATLSLAVYTSSTAVSLENQTATQIKYNIGADMVLYGDEDTLAAISSQSGPGVNVNEQPSLSESARWIFYPVSEHLKIDGVESAARVGNYSAVFRGTGAPQASQVIALDRLDFPYVTHWRDDYAQQDLNTLMNLLATTPDGVLLPQEMMEELALLPGDSINLVVDTDGENTPIDFQIVGGIELFPTWQPMVWNSTLETYVYKPLFVCNLDYLFQESGGQFPYDVWLGLEENANYDVIVAQAKVLDLRVMGWRATGAEIASSYLEPQRQGVTGILSVGFIGSAAFTVLSFVLYQAFSLRQRAIEVAVLRSVGLTRRSLRIWLAVELCVVLLTGMTVGLYAGTFLANALIPSLQVGSFETSVPPVHMIIAGQAVAGLGLVMLAVFLLSIGAIIWRMVRMQLFASLKLGETL